MGDEKKFAQVSTESIQIWGETVGITDLSQETIRALGADVTYRIQQALNVCGQILRHSNRRKLTSDDFNRALKLMDVPPVYGYSGSENVEWVNVPELGIQIPHDSPVNLASTALSGDIFHQPGSSYVKAEWAHVSGHLFMKSECNSEEKNLSALPLPPELLKYYQMLFSVITNSSKTMFRTMMEDVSSSANICPLVGPIISSVVKGAQKARQKPFILRRLLLVIRALLSNPHIHLGPQNYSRDLVNVLVFCIVTERKNPQDTQCIRILASNTLLKLLRLESRGGSSWELSAMSLSGVVASSTRPWTQHSGALMGLLAMGAQALHLALLPIAREYHRRLMQALANPPSVSSAISAKETLDAQMTHGLLLAGFISMMFSFVKQLPDKYELSLYDESEEENNEQKPQSKEEARNIELVQQVREVYNMGADMFGTPFIVQVPSVYLCWSLKTVKNMKWHMHRDTKERTHKPVDKSNQNGFDSGKFLPAAKRQRLSAPTLALLLSPKHKVSIAHYFESYRPIIPVVERKIFMCVDRPGWSARSFKYLKQKTSMYPPVQPHANRTLLMQYYNNRPNSLGRMPHWILMKKAPKICKLPMSLDYLIL